MKHLIVLTAVILCLFANFIVGNDNLIVSAMSVSNAGMENSNDDSQSNRDNQHFFDEDSDDKNFQLNDDKDSSPSDDKNSPPPNDDKNFQPINEKDTTDENSDDLVTSILIAVIAVLIVAVVILLVKIRKNKNRNKTRNNQDEKNFSSKRHGNFDVDVVFRVGNFQNIGQREDQQDSFCISDIDNEKYIRDKGIMAVVADGMGGLEGGAVISRLVVDTFIKSYVTATEIDPAKFLHDTAENAEHDVFKYKKRNGINGGSTVVAAIIKANELYTLSVGDSRIYLLRGDKLQQINQEHTFGEYLKEKARNDEVDKLEPYINPKRDALTAYIGMGSFLKVDEKHIQLQAGDKILLCSDGVFNTLSDDVIITALNGDALTAAEKMERVILAQNNPAQDNFTGVILEYVK